MAAGMDRLPAIRLYRRCRSNLEKALKYARAKNPELLEKRRAALVEARAVRTTH
jgi:hypothetical protein